VAETGSPEIDEKANPSGGAPYAGLFAKLKGIKAGDVMPES
jgi:hypothetical protein